MTKDAVIRIPRSKIILEADEYIVVNFGNAESFLMAVMASMSVSDKGQAVVMKDEKDRDV